MKETIWSLVRTVLTLVGTYIIGHNVFGHTVDENVWTVVIASVGTLFSTVWGIVDKTATIESVQSGLRSVVLGVGGFLVSWGVLKEETLMAILGILAALIPVFQSYTSRLKVKDIAKGNLTASSTTGKVEKSGPRISIMIGLLVLVGMCLSTHSEAQSFFKRLPEVAYQVKKPNRVRGIVPEVLIVQKDSVINAFRPIVNVAAYTVPGNIAMAGAGVSYQHLKYDYADQRWNSVWSVSLLAWAGGPLSPTSDKTTILSFGPAVGFLNNVVLVGAAYNGNRVLAMVGVGINLNN